MCISMQRRLDLNSNQAIIRPSLQPKHTSSEQITKPNLYIGRHPVVAQHPADAPSSSALSSQALAPCDSACTQKHMHKQCGHLAGMYSKQKRDHVSGRRLAGMYSKQKWDHVYSKQKWDLFSGRRLAGSKNGIFLAVADQFSPSGILPESFAVHL